MFGFNDSRSYRVSLRNHDFRRTLWFFVRFQPLDFHVLFILFFILAEAQAPGPCSSNDQAFAVKDYSESHGIRIW